MKKTILTTAAAIAILSATAAFSAKAATSTDCAALGYTNTVSGCSGKNILKCPFDNSKIYCAEEEDPTYDCAYAYNRYNVDWSLAIKNGGSRWSGMSTNKGHYSYKEFLAYNLDVSSIFPTGSAEWKKAYNFATAEACVMYGYTEKQCPNDGTPQPTPYIFDTVSCESYKERMILRIQRHNQKCPGRQLPTSGNFNPGAIQCNVCFKVDKSFIGEQLTDTLVNCNTGELIP